MTVFIIFSCLKIRSEFHPTRVRQFFIENIGEPLLCFQTYGSLTNLDIFFKSIFLRNSL